MSSIIFFFETLSRLIKYPEMVHFVSGVDMSCVADEFIVYTVVYTKCASVCVCCLIVYVSLNSRWFLQAQSFSKPIGNSMVDGKTPNQVSKLDCNCRASGTIQTNGHVFIHIFHHQC